MIVNSAHQPNHLHRIVADGSDRAAWLRARASGVTASDAAKLATSASVDAAVREKLHGSSFTGNAYTRHGTQREPVIADWVFREHGIHPNRALFHAHRHRRHLATPDGVVLRSGGRLELAEIKTTGRPWRSIPKNYLRQIWWQQYVLGAERTLMVWEQHNNFVPVGVPRCQWVDRDEQEVAKLLQFAGQLLEALRSHGV